MRFLGAHHIDAHRIYPFHRRQGFAKLGALAQKRGFACALKYQKCVHENSLKEIKNFP